STPRLGLPIRERRLPRARITYTGSMTASARLACRRPARRETGAVWSTLGNDWHRLRGGGGLAEARGHTCRTTRRTDARHVGLSPPIARPAPPPTASRRGQ